MELSNLEFAPELPPQLATEICKVITAQEMELRSNLPPLFCFIEHVSEELMETRYRAQIARFKSGGFDRLMVLLRVALRSPANAGAVLIYGYPNPESTRVGFRLMDPAEQYTMRRFLYANWEAHVISSK